MTVELEKGCPEMQALNRNSGVNIADVQSKMVLLRGQAVILDRDVAALYGVETKHVIQAVRNNPDKFPDGFVIGLTSGEVAVLRSNFLTLEQKSGKGHYSKHGYKVFTERGLYMLATILKGPIATKATLAIVNTYAQVRSLKRDLLDLNKPETKNKNSLMKRFGETLLGVVMPDPDTNETEASLELNFLIGKVKYTVRRVRKNGDVK